jgi:hypothetical protein
MKRKGLRKPKPPGVDDKVRNRMRSDMARSLLYLASKTDYRSMTELLERTRAMIREPDLTWKFEIAKRMLSRPLGKVCDEPSDVDYLCERVLFEVTPAEAPRFLDELERQWKLLADKRDNGESLAEEGRAAKAPNDTARAVRICSLYRRIRPSLPDGSRGNGAAVRDVAERYQSQTGKSITPRGVRGILKRHGMMPDRRNGKG